MTTLTFGDGTPAVVTLGDGTLVFGQPQPVTPPAPEGVVFTTTSASFSPGVELTSGSSATVSWMDDSGTTLATGIAPTLSFQGSATRSIHMVCSAPGDVRVVNIGFDHTQDPGRVGPGASYDKSPEQVTGVSGLAELTGLRLFLAANTPLTGHVDFTGLAELQDIECFNADITSITLTGCSGITRLCLEANRLSALDVNPVRTTLEDFRAAAQNSGQLTLTPLTGPLPHVWHYCVRDQPLINSIPHSQLPVVEQHWAWNTGQTTSDSPTSTVLNSYMSADNNYDQASVNRILVALNTLSPGGGYLDLGGSAAPSGAGLTARASMVSRGWTVITS